MARIRSVKPELRRDLTVAEWPREVRYAWVLLWGYLDDHGRGLDDLRLIVADLFPLDRDVTERKVDRWLTQMTAATPHGTAPLCRYEVHGRRYLHAPKWTNSQKVAHPQDSRLPACPTHDHAQHPASPPPPPHPNGSGPDPEPLGSDSRTDPEPFTPSRAPEDLGVKGSRDLGVKGSGGASQTPLAKPDPDFDQFWAAYPRHEARAAARKAWAKAARTTDPGEIIAGACRYAEDPNRDPTYTAHAASWLNDGRWDDEPQPARGPGNSRITEGDRVLRDAWERAADDQPTDSLKAIAGSHP